jgi:hypothetical protein
MGRHQRPQQPQASRDRHVRPRFGLAPLILAGAIVISYAVIRASGASTLMFTPPPQPPAISGVRPAHAPATPAIRTPATGARRTGGETPRTGGGGVSVACQFNGGIVCDVNTVGPVTSRVP